MESGLKNFQRQEQFFDHIPEGVGVVIPSGKTAYRNADVAYPFRVSSDFFYLTGLTDPDSFLILGKHSGQLIRALVLYDPSVNELQWSDQWSLTLDLEELSCYQLYSLKQESTLTAALQKLGLRFHCLQEPDQSYTKYFSDLSVHHELRVILDRMRVKKDPFELSCLQTALDHTQHSLSAIATAAREEGFTNEAQIASLWSAYGLKHHLGYAYEPIIAGGQRSCILHYQKNQASLTEDYAVLIDAGYEYCHYASDLTRMLLLKQPPPLWQDLYAVVHQVQQEVIALLAPGQTFLQLQEYTSKRLLEELQALKVLPSSALLSELKLCYMHGIGHFLGLDVHDAAALSKETIFEPSMTLTIEPGLYFNHPVFEESPVYGIGIRLEDNVVLTEKGYKNLTTLPSSLESVLSYV